jgi:hypothetical protein
MKMIKTLVLVCAFCASSVFAGDPQLSDMTCDDLSDNFALTDEAQVRYANLLGSCEGVYTVDGSLYAKTTAVIRSTRGGTVTVYIPATDRTFDVSPNPNSFALIRGGKMRVSELNRGDEFGIYVSVEQHALRVIDMVAFAAEDEAAEEIVEVSVVAVAALPTTG